MNSVLSSKKLTSYNLVLCLCAFLFLFRVYIGIDMFSSKLITFSGALLLLICMLYVKVTSTKINAVVTGRFLMLIIIMLNNWDWKNGDLTYIFYFVVMLLFIFFASFNAYWINPILKVMILFTLVHIIFTLCSYFSSSLYLNHIVYLFNEKYRGDLLAQYSKGFIPGLSTHYSVNGMYLGFGTGILFCRLFREKPMKRHAVVAVVSLIALLLTAKRGPFIFLCISLLITYFIYNSTNWIKRFFRILGSVIVIIILMYIISIFIPAITNVFSRIINYGEDITGGRTILFQLAIKIFKANLLIGSGWGSYKYYANSSEIGAIYGYESFMLAHNIYLQLLAETGIIGFTIFIVAMFYCLTKTIILLKQVRHNIFQISEEKQYYLLASLFIQLFFLMYGTTGNPLYDTFPFLIYSLGCAIYVSINSEIKYTQLESR